MALAVKNLPASAGDVRDAGLVPESRRSAGGQHYNPLQYSCLENPMDRGAWRSTGSQRVEHNWSDFNKTHSFTYLKRPSQPVSFLPLPCPSLSWDLLRSQLTVTSSGLGVSYVLLQPLPSTCHLSHAVVITRIIAWIPGSAVCCSCLLSIHSPLLS